MEELIETIGKYSSEDAKEDSIPQENLQKAYGIAVDLAAGFERLLREKERENANS